MVAERRDQFQIGCNNSSRISLQFQQETEETGDGSLSPNSDNLQSFLKKETENRPLSPLSPAAAERKAKLDAMMNAVNGKFGSGTLKKGSKS